MSTPSVSSSTSPPSTVQHSNPGRTLPESVRWAVDAFVKHQIAEGSVDNVDVYRCIREQADLLYERQLLLDAIQSDPFRQFEDVRPKLRNLKDRLDVTSCSRIMTWEGYALIQATVHVSKPTTATTTTPSFSLHFRYERQPSQNKVWYSIDLAADATIADTAPTTSNNSSSSTMESSHPLGSRRVLEIEVWTVGSRGPSSLPARPIEMEDVDDGDNDNNANDDENQHDGMELEGEVNNDNDHHHPTSEKGINGSRIPAEINHKKRTKPSPSTEALTTATDATSTKTKSARMQLEDTSPTDEAEDENDDDDSQILSSDRYSACLDPDILSDFMEWSQLQPMPDVTAFFLLMTFPYYELEWDLIGMVLESAFDDDGEEEDFEDMHDADDDENAKHARHSGQDKSDDDWDDDDEDEEAN